MLPMVVDPALLVAVTLATRIPFLLMPSSDKATQLWIIETFAANRRIAPLRFQNSLRQGMLAYPPLPHFFLAFLPRHLRLAAGAAVNLLADVIHVLIVYVVLRLLLAGHDTPGDVSPTLAFALLFATLPILHPVNARLAGIGARTIGPLLFTLYAMALFQAQHASSPLFHVVCIVTGIAIVLASQFALQVLVGISLFLSAWMSSVVPGVIVALSIGIGALIPGLNIGPQLRCKMQHYRWYASARNLHIDMRNSLAQIRKILGGEPRTAGPRLIVYLVSSTTPAAVVLGTGTLVLAAVRAWPWPDGVDANPFITFAVGIVIGASLLCLLTIRGPLRIFGEAERYVEYAAPFAVVVVASAYVAEGADVGAVLLLVILNCSVIAGQWTISVLPQLRSAIGFEPTDDLKALVAFLDRRPGRRIVTSPIFLASSLALLSRGEHEFLHVLVADADGRFSHWHEDLIGYPHLRGRASHFVERYRADTMVLERSSFEAIRRLDVEADLDIRPIAYQNHGFLVFELDVPARD
ncbi:hypothetical protein FK498_05785 [Elioraea sp. Yellowstone]|jgi:hypothetical protein|uniref:hypothetical protein n=1 Tax=unclassified Elioraea TaxID=2619524 RepID=UPI00115468E3|nr:MULTISPECIES: hypothetical protein [unclassified Elioraea]TQF80831.1 hypothetical protein FK498_05785 [Elioraea sp. Yellowstone]GIX11204.1 MAG: hypothetical protein KatS3mg116_2914 [Elioraea sp.]